MSELKFLWKLMKIKYLLYITSVLILLYIIISKKMTLKICSLEIDYPKSESKRNNTYIIVSYCMKLSEKR